MRRLPYTQVVRELISRGTPEGTKQKTILDTVVVHDPKADLAPVVRTEARVFLLYSTKKEAADILSAAEELGLTGKNYVWIATQSVIGASLTAPDVPAEFPPGMLGRYFYNLQAKLAFFKTTDSELAL